MKLFIPTVLALLLLNSCGSSLIVKRKHKSGYHVQLFDKKYNSNKRNHTFIKTPDKNTLHFKKSQINDNIVTSEVPRRRQCGNQNNTGRTIASIDKSFSAFKETQNQISYESPNNRSMLSIIKTEKNKELEKKYGDETNGMAVAALIMGILSIIPLFSPLAIIFGSIALYQIAKKRGKYKK